MDKFVKLGDLVDKKFTVIKNNGYKWKRWNKESNKMETSDTYQPFNEGWTKKYSVTTNKGIIDFGEMQLGKILANALKGNTADLGNLIVEVKSNGKTGMDIRYFFNVVGRAEGEVQVEEETQPEMGVDEIPW